MKVENIHDWGLVITLDSPQDFFAQTPDYWRDLIYNKPLIFFKAMNFTTADYAEFSLYFGKPWQPGDYRYSNESSEYVSTPRGPMVISSFSDKSKRLASHPMPWHSDIPNRNVRPFPFRSLWIVSNPNPTVSGLTSWMNMEKAIDYLTPEMKELLPRITVIQQSWYEPGTDVKELPMIKVQPVTGRQSLRLNYYNWGNNKEAWITGVKIDGVEQPDCSLIKEWIEHLEKIPELVYEHVWDTNDIAIYDNWSFLHARTRLFLNGKDETRKFYRINMDHLTTDEWAVHKDKYFK